MCIRDSVETYFNSPFVAKTRKTAHHNQGINIDKKINIKEKRIVVEIRK